MDRMQATPRNAFVGGLADFLAAGTSPQRTQQMRGLMEFLQVPDIAQTLDRVSYGEPLTTGAGMTTKLRPEAENALMAAMGMIPAGRPAEAGAMALGRAGERMAERVVPQVMERGGLPAEMLSAMAQGTQSPATVFHGSPHRFTKFDSSKIGTGEGAQVYGHGLYLAESPDVASTYASMSPLKGVVGSKEFESLSKDVKNKVIRAFQQDTEKGQEVAIKKVIEQHPEAAVFSPQFGKNLYQVDLPDEQIAKMLGYDKPLSKQPEYIKQQLLDLIEYEGLPEYLRKDIVEDRGLNTGQRVYEELVKTLGSDKAASEALRQASIPGIRYLDDGSRGAGKGTSNFVVFPGMEDMLRIEQINEQPIESLLQSLGR